MDVYAKTQEEEQDKKLADDRREITSQFIAMTKVLESQVEARLAVCEDADVHWDGSALYGRSWHAKQGTHR